MLCLVAAGLWSCISEPMDTGEYGTKLFVGDTIPPFKVVTLSNDTITRDNRQAGTLVILFFHTECGDCQKELPRMEEAYRQHQNDSLWQLICIGRSEPKEQVVRYWQQQQFTMPVSPQNNRLVYERFAHSGVPMLYIVDRKNRIRAVFDDQDMPTSEEIAYWITKVNEENLKDRD